MSYLEKQNLGDRSARLFKLMLIEPDPIYRAGLRVVLAKFADLQVVAEAETNTAALQILSEFASNATSLSELGVDLVLLELGLDSSESSQLLGLRLSQQLKTQYPNLPVLLFTSLSEPSQLTAAKQAGVDGYCPKGIPATELAAAIRQVATGHPYWAKEIEESRGAEESRSRGEFTTRYSPLARLRDRLRLSGLRQIDASLSEVTALLQDPGISLLDRAILAGQRRELLASRRLVNQLLAAPKGRGQGSGVRGQERAGEAGEQGRTPPTTSPLPPTKTLPLATRPISSLSEVPDMSLSRSTLPEALFASIRAKLQFSLENLTRVPLEIDILREGKKRELLDLIRQKIEDVLAELRFSQVQSSQLTAMRSIILRDLWQTATTDFFGKYSKLQVGEYQLDIVNTLLQEAIVVQTAILDRIPLVEELFSYLLFASPLVIDNASYPAGSLEAKERAEIILQNLLIQIANAVVQPLLNRFADVEAIKQKYYDRRLISTREIERFRNNLSWKYRLESYIEEPKRIFESRYELFLLTSRGIAKISIYAPRNQELAGLSGIQSLLTLALEFRDAIAPRIQAVVAFLGRSLVYVLTQVVGRAIGLIGRGILQGLGGSLQESKNKRF